MVETRRLSRLGAAVLARIDEVGPEPVAAVSGGADSAVAAWLVARAGGTMAIHVDHGQPASPVLRAAAEEVADAAGLTLVVDTASAGAGSEGALRTARYEAFRRRVGAGQTLVLGHTADDQAETVLMQLMRGSGLDGLAGMPRTNGPLVRPLLDLRRSETRELATLLELPWIDDPSNHDLAHFRNRIRLDLLPMIERSHAASFTEHLIRMADVVRDDLAIIEDATAGIPVSRRSGAFRIAVGSLIAAGDPVARRVIRRELMRVGDGFPPESSAVSRTLDVVHRRARRTQVPGGFTVSLDGPFLSVGRGSDSEHLAPRALLPGALQWSGFRIDVSVVDRPLPVPLSPWAAVIPLAADGSAPVIRCVQRGDRIGPPNRAKPVDGLLATAGIGARRRQWPVVELGGEVVWVPGVRRVGWNREGVGGYLCAVATEEATWGPFEP